MNSVRLVFAWVAAVVIIALCAAFLGAQPRTTPRPFDAYQSGGNCVYIVAGKYASFISVVPVGPGGC